MNPLHLLPPETAHELTLRLGAFAALWPETRYPTNQAVSVNGLQFAHSLGLPAGVDKDGRALALWRRLGAAWITLGTMTPQPQAGNPKPRVWRVPAQHAVINRMGFPNCGAHALAEHLPGGGRWHGMWVGVSVGKQATTPLAQAAEDYYAATQAVAQAAAWIEVNVSSPNTQGLRSLAEPAALSEILSAVRSAGAQRVWLKLSPDMNERGLEQLISAVEHQVDAFVAVNTTQARPQGIPDLPGGLSGPPLRAQGLQSVATLRRLTRLPIVGMGGVSNLADVQAYLAHGATLVGLYTALTYNPLLLSVISRQFMN